MEDPKANPPTEKKPFDYVGLVQGKRSEGTVMAKTETEAAEHLRRLGVQAFTFKGLAVPKPPAAIVQAPPVPATQPPRAARCQGDSTQSRPTGSGRDSACPNPNCSAPPTKASSRAIFDYGIAGCGPATGPTRGKEIHAPQPFLHMRLPEWCQGKGCGRRRCDPLGEPE